MVENGRRKGQKLDSGSFLAPEVSFDGKTILFAYSECKAKKTHTWGPEISPLSPLSDLLNSALKDATPRANS